MEEPAWGLNEPVGRIAVPLEVQAVLVEMLVVLATISRAVQWAQALHVQLGVLAASGSAHAGCTLIASDGTVASGPALLTDTGVGQFRLALQADAAIGAGCIRAGFATGDALLDLGRCDQLNAASLEREATDATDKASALGNRIAGQQIPIGYAANVQIFGQLQLWCLTERREGHRMLFVHLNVAIATGSMHTHRMPFVEIQWLLGTHHQGFATEIEAELGKAILERQCDIVSGTTGLSIEQQQTVTRLRPEG